MSRTTNVSSLSSIDDCFYYHFSLTAMFCPSIFAFLIALYLSMRVLTLGKQKKEEDTLCGSPDGNAVVLVLIGLFYPIFLLGFSIYFGWRKIKGKERKIGWDGLRFYTIVTDATVAPKWAVFFGNFWGKKTVHCWPLREAINRKKILFYEKVS